EPDMRHSMDFMSEMYLGYTPMPISKLIGDGKGGAISNLSGTTSASSPSQSNMADVPLDKITEYAAEDADVTWQLRAAVEPLLKERGQERVFYEIESPLVSVLADMELEGIKLDATALTEFSRQLAKE